MFPSALRSFMMDPYDMSAFVYSRTAADVCPHILVGLARRRNAFTLPTKFLGPHSGYHDTLIAVPASGESFGVKSDFHFLDAHIGDLSWDGQPISQTLLSLSWENHRLNLQDTCG